MAIVMDLLLRFVCAGNEYSLAEAMGWFYCKGMTSNCRGSAFAEERMGNSMRKSQYGRCRMRFWK